VRLNHSTDLAFCSIAHLGSHLELEAVHGVDGDWDAPVLVWSSPGLFKAHWSPQGRHTVTVRLGGSSGMSFLGAGGEWRLKPAGAGLAICPADAPGGLASEKPVRFAEILLPTELTRQFCQSLFSDCEPIRPFGPRLTFCSDERLCADAAALVRRALDVRDRPTRVEMNARSHLLILDLLRQLSPLSPNFGRWSGGLAPWQARRAEELMRRNLAEDLRLADVARECGLSVAYFSRNFCKTFGAPPYRWFQTRRIERAKALLSEGGRPIAEIAVDCGFADQSHFTRVFTKLVGVGPGAWRKLQRT
jgi:AraC-like DNA-binding protein